MDGREPPLKALAAVLVRVPVIPDSLPLADLSLTNKSYCVAHTHSIRGSHPFANTYSGISVSPMWGIVLNSGIHEPQVFSTLSTNLSIPAMFFVNSGGME